MTLIKSIKVASHFSLISLYESYKLKKLKLNRKQVSTRYFQSTTVHKLHLGCGGHIRSGWLNSDLTPYSDEVILLDASKTFAFENDTFDYIYSEHVLEHLSLLHQINMLGECYRVLKPGGKIRIATPDIDFIISLSNNSTEEIREYIKWSSSAYRPDIEKVVGDLAHSYVYTINNYFHNWGHQFLHNKKSLRELLGITSYNNIINYPLNSSDDTELMNLELHGTVISHKYNEMETMVFEASKSVLPRR